MKFIRPAALALTVAALFTANASDYSHYYKDLPIEMRQVSAITFPDRSTSITRHGAVGDGVTLCTGAIQGAIDSLATIGGGRVEIPMGVWLTGPIELKSNINLVLDKNAILYFSPDKSLYIDSTPKATRVKACISAFRCDNIGITGSGIIDGNGAQWRPVKRGKVSDTEWKDYKEMGGIERDNGSLWYPWQMKAGYADIDKTPEKQEKRRNDLFRVNHCKNILLEGVTFQNAPKFHVHPFNSFNVIMDGITVRCPWNAQNGDAIDLSDCHQVLVVNSTVDCGDDGLCLKSGEPRKTDINGVQDVLLRYNTVYHAHGGFVIGSEDICGINRVVATDCRFSGTDTGLRFKSAIGRGGKTGEIHLYNIMMADIRGEAIIFECSYADRPAGSKGGDKPVAKELKNVPEFTGIHISDIVCRGCKTGIKASGIEGMDCVHDIDVTDCTIVYRKDATAIDTATARLNIKDVKFVKEGNK